MTASRRCPASIKEAAICRAETTVPVASNGWAEDSQRLDEPSMTKVWEASMTVSSQPGESSGTGSAAQLLGEVLTTRGHKAQLSACIDGLRSWRSVLSGRLRR